MSQLNSLASSRQMGCVHIFFHVLSCRLLLSFTILWSISLFSTLYACFASVPSYLHASSSPGTGLILFFPGRRLPVDSMSASHQETAMEQDSTKGHHGIRRGRVDV